MVEDLSPDALVRRFAGLIAALTTRDHGATYIGHLPDLFFVSLVEALGADYSRPQKAAADMMGVTIRTLEYRLSKARRHSGTFGRTLWGEVYRFVQEAGPVSRADIEQRFRAENHEMLASILRAMRNTGALEERIRGRLTTFCAPAHFELLGDDHSTDKQVVLVALYINGDSTLDALCQALTAGARHRERIEKALDDLVATGAVARQSGAELVFRAMSYDLPRSVQTSSAAFYDHLDAVLGALEQKIRDQGSADGSTYRLMFEESDPRIEQIRDQVHTLRATIGRVRSELDREAAECGEIDAGVRMTLYLGQAIDAL